MRTGKYDDDYVIREIEQNGKIKRVAIYKGTKYAFADDAATQKRKRAALLTCCVLCFLLFFGAGFIDNDAMRQFYVALPYVALFLPCCLVLLGVIHLFGLGATMTRKELDRSVRSTQNAAIAALVCGGVTLLGDAAFCVLKGVSVKEGIFALCIAAYLAAAFAALKIARDMPIAAVNQKNQMTDEAPQTPHDERI